MPCELEEGWRKHAGGQCELNEQGWEAFPSQLGIVNTTRNPNDNKGPAVWSMGELIR